MPRTSPRRKLERDILQPPAAGVARPGEREVFDAQQHFARPANGAEIDRLDFAADHQVRDFAGVRCLGVERLDPAAVAEDRDAIGQMEHLVHLVRDVEDRDAPFAQPLDHAVQPAHFRLGEGARRLVHDEDVAL
jgi:hypothetical protein